MAVGRGDPARLALAARGRDVDGACVGRCRPTSRRANRSACRLHSSRPGRRGAGRSRSTSSTSTSAGSTSRVRAEVEVLPVAACRDPRPGTLEGLVAAARALEPEEEPVVVSSAARARPRVRRPDRRAAGGRRRRPGGRPASPRARGPPTAAAGASSRPRSGSGPGARLLRRGARPRPRWRGEAGELRGEARADHRRARLHRLEPRAAPGRGRGRGHARRLADPRVRRQPREHRRDRGRACR